jgi:hypothetical protein
MSRTSRGLAIPLSLLMSVGSVLFGQDVRSGSSGSLPPIVFVSRNPVPDSLQRRDGALPGFGPRHRTIAVGGRLMLRAPDGSLRALVNAAQLYDVADPSVSWDAQVIVFSGLVHADSNWRIYRINVDGRGLTQVTRTDRSLDLSQFGPAAKAFTRYDDFDPCWLPDGRIVFASTRHPSMASLGQVLTSNLYVVNPDGSDLHRITSERNGAEEPTIDPLTGRVVFARWWVNLDLPSSHTHDGLTREPRLAVTNDNANLWHAMSVNPDGNLLKLYAGFVRTRFGTQTYKPYVMADGRLLSTFSPQMSLISSPGGMGIRWFKAGADFGHHVVGVNTDDSLQRTQRASPPYATDPVELTRNSILFSYSTDGRDYGVYTCTLDGKNLKRVVDLPGTLELEPQPVQRRKVPPVLKDEFPPILSELPPTDDPTTYFINDTFRFDCMNIFTNGAVDEPIPDAPRITKGAKIRFFLSTQRKNTQTSDPAILIKTADVFPMGGVHEPGLPADVPLFEQVIDSNGNVLETTTNSFAHVPGMNYERFGGGTKCVGCHAGHSMLTVPVSGSLSQWFNASTSARVTASSSFINERGMIFLPQRVVDRQASSGGDSVIWVANEGAGASLLMKWDIPIDVRQFVLYGISPDEAQGTKIRVQNSKIVLYYDSNEVASIDSTGLVLPEGTRITLPVTKIDSARIVITKFSGTVYHRPFAGLAEVETIARISAY